MVVTATVGGKSRHHCLEGGRDHVSEYSDIKERSKHHHDRTILSNRDAVAVGKERFNTPSVTGARKDWRKEQRDGDSSITCSRSEASQRDRIAGSSSRSDKSAASDIKSNKSSSSRSRKSSSKSSTSSKKEQSSISTSKRRQVKQQSESDFWSRLSVCVAMAVMQANGSTEMAQKASIMVLVEGRRQNGQERSSKMMGALSAKISVALLEAGADRKISLAVMNAIKNDDNVAKPAASKLIDVSSVTKTNRSVSGDIVSEMKSTASSVAPSLAPSIASSHDPSVRSKHSKAATIRSNSSKAASSTPSMSSKPSKLRAIEMQILEKQRAIEEAEKRNREKEKELSERMAALEAASKERLAAAASLLEEEKSIQTKKQVASEYERESFWNSTKQEDNAKEEVSSFQSGVNGFLGGVNKQYAAFLEPASSLVGASTADEQSFTAERNRNFNKDKDLEGENRHGNGTVSAFQSGIDGFLGGFNKQYAAAKEGLADLDATSTAFLENAGVLISASKSTDFDRRRERRARSDGSKTSASLWTR